MKFFSHLARPVRSAVFGFCLAGAGLAGWQSLAAQAIGSHDSNAPVNYAADRIELQDRQDRVVMSGNVDITQAGLRLRAERTTVAFTNQGSLKIQRIDATGGVLVTRNDESAHGDVAVYDFNRKIITMAGNVALRRGGSTLNGGRLVIDLNTGVASVDGRAGGASSGSGRVSGTFEVPKRN